MFGEFNEAGKPSMIVLYREGNRIMSKGDLSTEFFDTCGIVKYGK